MANPNEETKVDFSESFASSFFADDHPAMDVQLAAATHRGKVRSRNEDHYAVLRRTRSCEMLLTNLPADDLSFVEDHAYVLLVADGIGGAQFGDFASQLAIESTLQAAGLATSWVMKFKDLDAQEVRKRITAYVDRIQEIFQKYGSSDPEKRQMGTTLTGAYLLPPHAIIAHIGDSRAYLFRGGIRVHLAAQKALAEASFVKQARQLVIG